MEDILEFWFGKDYGLRSDDEIAAAQSSLWWNKSAETDARIRERFGDQVEAALAGDLVDWANTPRGRLALVLLLDQFTRNIFRDEPRCYAGDAKAVALAEGAVDAGADVALRPIERTFLYMPMMHAESIDVQNRCVRCFESLSADQGPAFEHFLDHARQHRDIVARFGRFPHRNELLDRDTTAEEAQFLTQPGSSF